MIISIDDIIKILKSKWYIGIILSILILIVFHFFIIPQEIGKKENTIQTLLASPIYSELAYFQFKKEIDIIKEKYKTNLIRLQDYIQSYSPFKIILFSEWSNKTPNNLIIEFKKDLFASYVKSIMLNKDLNIAVDYAKKYLDIINKTNYLISLSNKIFINTNLINSNNMFAGYFDINIIKPKNQFEILMNYYLLRNTNLFITNFSIFPKYDQYYVEPRIKYLGFGNIIISNIIIKEKNNLTQIILNPKNFKHETGYKTNNYIIAKEIINKEGYIFYLDYLKLEKGDYEIIVEYSSDKPNYKNWNNYIISNINALLLEKEKYRFIENYITNIIHNKFDYERYKNLVYITDLKKYYYETVNFYQRIIIIGLFSILSGFTILIFSVYWLMRG